VKILLFVYFLFEVLAAWFRLKYPHIAIGALAASAPILEFDNLVPWDGFYRIVSENFKVRDSIQNVHFVTLLNDK
jgi:hypothetical protein